MKIKVEVEVEIGERFAAVLSDLGEAILTIADRLSPTVPADDEAEDGGLEADDETPRPKRALS